MKNISKNLFLVLTGVCVVALIVFFIQLIVINAGSDPKEPGSVVSEGSSGQEGDSSDDEEDPDNPFGDYTPPPAVRPPPQGTRYEIVIDDENTLVIYAEEEKFDYIENDLNWRFEYKSGGNAALEISFVLLLPQGVAADAEAFLNARIGGETAEYKGLQPIINSDVDGYSVQAQSGGITYEAWLHRPLDSDLALAFLINYEFNGPRDDLYTVLSSMSIEQG